MVRLCVRVRACVRACMHTIRECGSFPTVLSLSQPSLPVSLPLVGTFTLSMGGDQVFGKGHLPQEQEHLLAVLAV